MPWETPYWQAADEKWLPSYWPPCDFQIIDSSGFWVLGKIPEGEIVPWWLQPKDQWPYETGPWAQKVFGALTARKVMMPENFQEVPSIWPGRPRVPPFGYMKVNTPYYPKLGSHQLASIKVHMRPKPWLDISPHPSLWVEGKLEEALRVMTHKRPIKLVTDSGTITLKSIRAAPWNQYKDNTKILEKAIKAKREEAHMAQLAEEIARTKGEPKPTKDLFE
jgi:hypothetical protein